MKLLITGGGGMVASYLAEYALEQGDDVVVTTRWTEDMSRIKHIQDKITNVSMDLNDFVSILRTLVDHKPDVISHLAAQSYVGDGFTNPLVTIQTNMIGSVNLFEAIRFIKEYMDKSYDPIIHVCSSSEYYGKVPREMMPITEDHKVSPMNQYAVGKAGMDIAAKFYFDYYGLKTIRTRMFTHTSGRRTMGSAEVNFARQIAGFEKDFKNREVQFGDTEPQYILKHGNLNSVRTWAHVKDAVRAYYLLFKKGKPGEVYNIGGREANVKTIKEMLDYMVSLSPIKDRIKLIEDPALVRKVDVDMQIVDYSKFKADTGWEPIIPFEEIIKEILQSKREE